MAYDLVVLGDLVADLIVPVERLPIEPNRHSWAEGIFVEPGGAGNVLVAARRMALATACIGAIGADRYGAEMLAMLATTGVDVQHARIDALRQTVLCMVLSDMAGQHVYLGIKDRIGRWGFDPAWLAICGQTRALFTDGYTLRDVFHPADIVAAMQRAQAAGALVAFDPGPSIAYVPAEDVAPVLRHCDLLLLTYDEAELLAGTGSRAALAGALLQRGPRLVVLKDGADGCWVADATGIEHVPGFTVDVVDTVGAGDAFAAAFIAGLLRGATPACAATLANAMGALVATGRGAGTRIPPRDHLLAMLAAHPAALAVA
jgi:2-dehydro-3-deoxygluconokinase